jgi:competence protein ComEA
VVARWHALGTDRRIVAAVCACAAVVAGVAWWRAGSSAPALPAAAVARPAPSAAIATDPATTSTQPATEVVVDVVGAVRRPGVVRVHGGARVIDAIAAAGGARPAADLSRLNLAARVTDGSRVAVPNVGEPAPAVDPAAVSGSAAASGDTGAPSGPININTATAAELDALPGVGPTTAAAIVQDRAAHGPFRSVDDLGRVRGIGPAKLAQLHDLVTV